MSGLIKEDMKCWLLGLKKINIYNLGNNNKCICIKIIFIFKSFYEYSLT